MRFIYLNYFKIFKCNQEVKANYQERNESGRNKN